MAPEMVSVLCGCDNMAYESFASGAGSNTDFQIHLAIARASKVKTIYQILKLILSSDNVYAKFSYVSDHMKNTQVKQHESLIQAFCRRDPDKAGEFMELHLNQIMDDVKQYYQEPASHPHDYRRNSTP